MTQIFEPPPTYADPFIQEAGKEKFNPIWLRWFLKLIALINSGGGGGGGGFDHNSLSGLQGGASGEEYHLTNARYSVITGAQSANTVLAGPTTGAAAVSGFRALVSSDLPAGTGTVTQVNTGTGLSGGPITTTGTISVNFTVVAPLASPVFTGTVTYDLAQGNADFIKQSIAGGATLTVPAGYGFSVVGPYVVTGDLVVLGDMVVL